MRFVFAVVTWLLLAASPVLAHPHIFIDAKVRIIFDDQGRVAEIHNTWTFDDAFSAWQIQGLDVDNDGVTSEAEMAELTAETMQGLGTYDFYTFAGEGPDNLTLEAAGDGRMWNENGHSILDFGVRPVEPYSIQDTLELAINDPEYYVSISFADASAITLENAPPGCEATITPPREMEPELADQLYALPADVTELPPALAAALRGVQGQINISCSAGAGSDAQQTALEATEAVGKARPVPFGGPPPEPGLPMPRTGFLGWVHQQQIAFYGALNEALSSLTTGPNALPLLGGLSFLYGIFHAAGPGHGKVVISSYMLANERQVRRGVVLSFISAMLQSTVAVAIVLILAVLLRYSGQAMNNATQWMSLGSYALLAILGLWLVVRQVFGHRRTSSSDHGHDHYDHDHEEEHEHEHLHAIPADRTAGSLREQIGVVLAVGLRPCSGALVVLAFALSQGLLAAGILSVFLMGIGTAISVAVLAMIAVGAKGLAVRMAGARDGLASGIAWWIELGGALLVLAMGVLLLLAEI